MDPGSWVFVIWFLLADGTIPQPKISEPFPTWAECDKARVAAPVAETVPAHSVGYILTHCTTRHQARKEAQR